jgi:SAM-dependent methyltransferase
MPFKDHFSGHAKIYRDARPNYPDQLFDWLAGQAPAHQLAWDCGCGNGQATVAIAEHFARTIGTDPSAAQISNAQARANIEYRVEPAEQSSLASASVDLICVAQAMHWFDLDRFYPEVRRVLKPHGVLAAVAYADCAIAPEIDAIKNYLYVDLLDSYWPPERRLVEQRYRTIDFPFVEIAAPHFDLVMHWDAAQFLAYLRSWSATQRYVKERGVDPVDLIEADMLAAWDKPDEPRDVRWALTIRAGRI